MEKKELERLRRLLLVHSYLYYQLDNPLVSDHTWTSWAKRIIELQSKGITCKYEEKQFKDFKTPTGYNFYYDSLVRAKAAYLIWLSENKREWVQQP